MAGVVCTPLFHCPRCKDHWLEFGTVPEDCQFKRQPTRGPAIHMARGRKPRKDYRKKKTKRRLGFVDAFFSLLETLIFTSMTGNLVCPQTLYIVLSSSRSDLRIWRKVLTQGGGPEPTKITRSKKRNCLRTDYLRSDLICSFYTNWLFFVHDLVKFSDCLLTSHVTYFHISHYT